MESYTDSDNANSPASDSSDSYLFGSRKIKKCSRDDYAKKYKNYEKSYHKEKYLKNRSQKHSSSRSPDYEKSGMPPLSKLHGTREKLRHISIKRESPETDSSGGSKNKHRRYQIPNDYDPNLKIKQEPIDDDYRASNLDAVGSHESMKHRVSRWEKDDASVSVKQEPRSPSHSRSRSPVHRHRHHKSSHRSSHREQHRDHHDSNRYRQKDERQREDRKREAAHRRRGGENPFVTSASDFGNRGHNSNSDTANAAPVKEKPSMELSGKLTEHSNTYNGIVVKYNEPAEARKPKRRWRLYPFKGLEDLPVLPIHRQSAYLIGRERLVADIPVGHPSISKQHAVLQFRKVPFNRADGTTGYRVRPYIIDLNSSNGTYINCKRIQSQCYVELFEKDLIKFGFSTREYVILHEDSNTREVQVGDEVSE